MKNQFKSFSMAMIAVGIGVLMLFMLSAKMGNDFPADHPLAMFGLVLGVGISALGMLLKANRFHFYGLLVFAALSVGEVLNQISEGPDLFILSVLFAGGSIILSGCIVLIRFLRKHMVISTK